MLTDFLQLIDWRQPWLAPVRPIAEQILQGDDWLAAMSAMAARQGLANAQRLPISFVPQEELPAGMAYETFIYDTGRVPTRNNLHDFFNALIWQTFPRVKIALNQLQALEIRRRSAASLSMRGRLRDAATIFDENAVLLLTSDPSMRLSLREHQWRRVFIEQRTGFDQHCMVYLFGHALMEKLVAPYKAITGHTWVVKVSPDVLAMPELARREWLDKEVASQLEAGLSTSDFSHLPVLGVPGWWPEQSEAFYADVSVFRPARQRQNSDTERDGGRCRK
jgi:hypothetical protein